MPTSPHCCPCQLGTTWTSPSHLSPTLPLKSCEWLSIDTGTVWCSPTSTMFLPRSERLNWTDSWTNRLLFYYNSQMTWGTHRQHIHLWNVKYVEGVVGGIVHYWFKSVSLQGEIKLSVTIEDEANKDLPSAVQLFRPIRQYVYGVLFSLAETRKKAERLAARRNCLPECELWGHKALLLPCHFFKSIMGGNQSSGRPYSFSFG